jgi:hypothetical protein
MLAAIRQRVNAQSPQKNEAQDEGTTKSPHPLIRWSVQEIRRIAVRMTQRQIQPAFIISWSLWRRAHQAAAQRAHLKKTQL